MSEENQYKTPTSNVEQSSDMEYGTVSWSSASGRLGRIRYITYGLLLGLALMIIIGILSMVFGIGMAVIGGTGMTTDGISSGAGIGGIIFWLFLVITYIAAIVIGFRLMMQRVHDFNMSGWLCLLYFVPIIGFFFVLVLLFLPGTDGENNYGKKTPPNNSGVTILVIIFAVFMTIAMIGVLAAIAIPAYQGYVQKAQEMQMEQSQ